VKVDLATEVPGEKPGKVVIVEGIVSGERKALETTLALYVMKLASSPLFLKPVVQSSKIHAYEGYGEVLRFVMKMELV
jgi:hypothetical protein